MTTYLQGLDRLEADVHHLRKPLNLGAVIERRKRTERGLAVVEMAGDDGDESSR